MDSKKYLAHYMEFSNKYTGKLNKYGGFPTHLPPQWPEDDVFGEWTFLCQFYCDGKILSIPDTLCIQIYQLFMDGCEASDPVIIQVPLGAKKNTEELGIADVYLGEGDINFKEVWEEITKESAGELEDKNGVFLQASKLGGWCPADEIRDKKFLGMISDGDAFSPFNWGGVDLFMFLDEENQVKWDFY